MFIDHFLSKNFNNLFNKNIDDIEREILNLAIAELKKNYNLFEEKSIEEFFYVKNESIREFSKK